MTTATATRYELSEKAG